MNPEEVLKFQINNFVKGEEAKYLMFLLQPRPEFEGKSVKELLLEKRYHEVAVFMVKERRKAYPKLSLVS